MTAFKYKGIQQYEAEIKQLKKQYEELVSAIKTYMELVAKDTDNDLYKQLNN